MIRRTYMCPECGHYMTVDLTMDQADDPPPSCPRCMFNPQGYTLQPTPMQQDFQPVAIGGSVRSKAEKMTEDILRNDYHVADLQRDHRDQSTPKVRYQDQRPQSNSTWGIAREALETAMAAGRQTRLKHGSGLDILQANLKSGVEPDLIEVSKRRAMRVW